MSDRAAEVALYAMMLILPLSALVARQLPIGSVLKMALAWGAIFAVATILIAQRDRVASAWNATRDALFGRDQLVAGGGTVRLRMRPDGHFWATVTISGVDRRMLIDSGATTTALSFATATAAGIDLNESAFPRMIDTANGEVVARAASVDRLSLGAIEAHGLPVVISEAFGETDVLGMNFCRD